VDAHPRQASEALPAGRERDAELGRRSHDLAGRAGRERTVPGVAGRRADGRLGHVVRTREPVYTLELLGRAGAVVLETGQERVVVELVVGGAQVRDALVEVVVRVRLALAAVDPFAVAERHATRVLVGGDGWVLLLAADRCDRGEGVGEDHPGTGRLLDHGARISSRLAGRHRPGKL